MREPKGAVCTAGSRDSRVRGGRGGGRDSRSPPPPVTPGEERRSAFSVLLLFTPPPPRGLGRGESGYRVFGEGGLGGGSIFLSRFLPPSPVLCSPLPTHPPPLPSPPLLFSLPPPLSLSLSLSHSHSPPYLFFSNAGTIWFSKKGFGPESRTCWLW